jgi:hypothetical protein
LHLPCEQSRSRGRDSRVLRLRRARITHLPLVPSRSVRSRTAPPSAVPPYTRGGSLVEVAPHRAAPTKGATIRKRSWTRGHGARRPNAGSKPRSKWPRCAAASASRDHTRPHEAAIHRLRRPGRHADLQRFDFGSRATDPPSFAASGGTPARPGFLIHGLTLNCLARVRARGAYSKPAHP